MLHNTRERILDAAEVLFTTRGYTAVTLRDIAVELDLKHASLYYHAPGGKEQIYIEVIERSFNRHRARLVEVIQQAGADVRDQVRAIADYVVEQPPLAMSRLMNDDMPAIDPVQAARLRGLIYRSLHEPITAALEQANAAHQTALVDLPLASMALISLLQSVHSIPGIHQVRSKRKLAHRLAEMLLTGWLVRPEET